MDDASSPESAILKSQKLHLPATCNPPGENNPPKEAVWIIFGATGHMGSSLVRSCLAHGDKITAVGRSGETQLNQMQDWHENCMGMLCDVRVQETVTTVIKRSISHWGHVDVIVNCTGYGVIGSCEDQDEQELRNQFETNFSGTLNIIHASLPYFRQRQSGRYVIFSSTSGSLGVPGLGPYCATKYAVEGLIESMLYEIDAFNIKATLVEPGHVRIEEAPEEQPANASNSYISTAAGTSTEAKGLKEVLIADGGQTDKSDANATQKGNDRRNSRSSRGRLPKFGHFLVKAASEPYASDNAPAGHAKRMVQWLGDRKPTSAARCAECVWQLGHCSYPPLRLLLGMYAVESIRDRLKSITEEIEDWKHLSFPTSGPGNDEGGDGDKDGADVGIGGESQNQQETIIEDEDQDEEADAMEH